MTDTNNAVSSTKKFVGIVKKSLPTFSRTKTQKPGELETSAVATVSILPGDLGIKTGSSSNIAGPSLQEDAAEKASKLCESRREANDKVAASASADISSDPNLPVEPRDILQGPGDAKTSRQSSLVASPELALNLDHEVAAELWDVSYESLKAEYPRLLNVYERLLADYLTRGDGGGLATRHPSEVTPPENEIAQTDRGARREQMNCVLDNWFSSSDRGKDAYVHLGASSLRGIVGKAMQGTRYVALPWAVSCLFAEQRFLNPNSSSEGIRSGIIYVISRMKWYISLSNLLLVPRLNNLGEPEPRSDSDPLKLEESPSYESLKCGVIDLYKAILLYQIRESVPRMTLQAIVEQEEALAKRIGGQQIETQLRQLCDAAELKRRVDTNNKDNKIVAKESSDTNSETSKKKSLETLVANLNGASTDSQIFASDSAYRSVLKILHQWLSSTEQYRRFLTWDGENDCRVLWIKGAPGTGKTMLLRAVVSRLLTQSFLSEKLVYFFCDRRKFSKGGSTAAIKSFICQVLKEQPLLADHMSLTEWDHFNDPNDFYAMSTVLYSMLEDNNFAATYFIVDAIEELCADSYRSPLGVGPGPPGDERGLDDLLGFIATTSRAPGYSHKIKWLVSLGNNKIDPKRTQQDAKTQAELDLNWQLQDLLEATNQYVASKVDEIAQQEHYRGQLQSEITQRLQEMSSGNFLWVSMSCEVIKSTNTSWNSIHTLEGSGKDINSLYRLMKDGISKFERDDPVYCNSILSTAVIAFRPLHVNEVVGIVDLPPEGENGVLQTLYRADFLTMDMKQNQEVSQENAKMIERCLKNVLKVSVCNDEPMSDSYATTFWLDHLSDWGPDSDLDKKAKLREAEIVRDTMALVIAFLSDPSSLVHWFDILAKQELLPQALTKMRILKVSLTQKMQSLDDNGNSNKLQADIPIRHLTQKIQELIWLLNFHQLLEGPADLNPKNTLLFCPANNTLRKMLLPKGFPWLDSALILTKPSVEPLNNSLYIRYDHHGWVRCCAYSPDGRLIVSGCNDGKVWIRNAETGLVQKVFNTLNNFVQCVVFSGADAGLMAASSYTKIVLWDVTTAQQKKELKLEALNKEVSEEQEPPYILDIALSAAGDKLAAAAGDTVRVWDIPSYEMIELPPKSENELEGLSTKCVRFSPGSEGLLAWTQGHIIIIWNLHTGGMQGILTGHEAGINGLAFSPKGKFLASASDDFKGQHVLSASRDSTLRVWDIENINPAIDTLSNEAQVDSGRGHMTPICFVAFSKDGQLIASGSDGGLICLWGTDDGAYIRSFYEDGTTSDVLSLMFPHNPKLKFLVATYKDVVRIWNTDSGDLMKLVGHSDLIRATAISPDNRLVASSSDDMTVRLW
ncbi:hypothetical protein B7494_g7116 [Chlorociboria aeruginascens]|nr:hypothetical protein B7494_g7116 [Chlorociboria aeruginascens]